VGGGGVCVGGGGGGGGGGVGHRREGKKEVDLEWEPVDDAGPQPPS